MSAAVRQRCIDLRVPSNGSYVQANPQIGVTTGGNRLLTPETSTSINISLAYSPAWLQDRPWVDSVDLELAYYDIRLDSAISALDAQLQLGQCVLNADDKACMGIVRSPEGAISAFDNVLQNIGGINIRGLDLTLSYRMPRQSFGRFHATPRRIELPARLRDQDAERRRAPDHRPGGHHIWNTDTRIPQVQVQPDVIVALQGIRHHVDHSLYPLGD